MNHLQELGQNQETIPIPLGVELGLLKSHCNPEAFTFDYFQNFPYKTGWRLKGENLDQDPRPGYRIKRRGDLLQAWLFFGLIFTVVRNNEGSLVKRIEELLVNEGKTLSKGISTECLKEKLKEWAESEKLPTSADEATRRAARMRIIRVGLVLNLARALVHRYCSHTGEGPDGYMYTSKPGKNEQLDYMDDAVALSLLVLGETISAVYMNILKGHNDEIQVSRWSTEGLEGWGQPRWVLVRMSQEGWCPRSIFLLRRQLGSHATLLLNAFYSHRHSIQLNMELHKKCDHHSCVVTSPFELGSPKYAPSHHKLSCTDSEAIEECETLKTIGPVMEKIYGILDKPDNDMFPLVRLCTSESSRSVVGLEVLEGREDSEYVTISHVWSDGYGNMDSNTVWHCQLSFIQRLLEKAVNDSKMAFWMDTLVIPMGESAACRKRRRKSIQQIYKVFKWSRCTIVLDRGLISLAEGDRSSELCLTAMKILSSGWMRRLWTLQEAFQSDELWVAFQESGTSVLTNFDDIQKELRNKAAETDSIMAGLIEQKMSTSIMNGERWRRIYNRPSDTLKDATEDYERKQFIIASFWRAARWRTTSRREHETVALATLLGIQESETERYFSKAIADVPKDINKTNTVTDHDLQKLMKDFWTKVAMWGDGCIPPGIIFLPGKRMTLKGFGWAPRTFMNPEDIGHPNPLSLTQKTELKPEHGLIVAYPGFMLHADEDQETRNSILETGGKFRFPVDKSFMEWYEVEPKPELGSTLFEPLSRNRTQLAVLLSRPSPKESPPEVGLLVEICEPEASQIISDPGLRFVQFAEIVFRVHVRRIHVENANMNQHLKCRGAIFGEEIPPKQKWCLDGHRSERLTTMPTTRESPIARLRTAATMYLRRSETEPLGSSDPTSGLRRSDTAPAEGGERAKGISIFPRWRS